MVNGDANDGITRRELFRKRERERERESRVGVGSATACYTATTGHATVKLREID